MPLCCVVDQIEVLAQTLVKDIGRVFVYQGIKDLNVRQVRSICCSRIDEPFSCYLTIIHFILAWTRLSVENGSNIAGQL